MAPLTIGSCVSRPGYGFLYRAKRLMPNRNKLDTDKLASGDHRRRLAEAVTSAIEDAADFVESNVEV